MSDYLRRLAERACGDPWFFGWALAAYQQRHGLDDAALAAELGCVPDVLVMLRLCRRPGTAEPGRRLEGDIDEIVRRFAVDPAVLARIVKEAGAAG
jgi:hypothetical protein